MQKWEYFTTFVEAKASDWKDVLAQMRPNELLPEFTPEALVPLFNSWGELGWELISIQPVYVGERGDVYVVQTGVALQAALKSGWTHTYFCALKRPKA